jgi:hypothetical protein
MDKHLTDALRAGLAAYLEANYRPKRTLEKKMAYSCQSDCAPMAACSVQEKAPVRQSLGEWLKKADAGFSETLLKHIDQSGKKDAEIYNRANLSRQHFSKIRNNPGYRPTKPTALALAIALELDLEQTKDLIGRAGYALTNSSKFDLIVMYFIEQRHYDLNDINEALYEYDQSLLGM